MPDPSLVADDHDFSEGQPLSFRSQFIMSRMKMIFEGSGGTEDSLRAALGGRYSGIDFDDLPATPMTILNKNALRKPSSRQMPVAVQRRIMTEVTEKEFFYPCYHEGKCIDGNADCACVQHKQLCTEQCIWGKYSANLLTGCDCKSGCKTEFQVNKREMKKLTCPCALAAAECDPRLCKCRNCQNQKMTNHRVKKFVIAPSTIPGAGTGLFTKYKIAKDDFVGEVSK